MENIPSFNALIEKSIVTHWDRDALTDYKGKTLQYHDVARKIEKLHILFENSGVQKGDKIALCGRNCSNWAVAFLATLTYGAVAVPILHEFTADQIHNIVNHSTFAYRQAHIRPRTPQRDVRQEVSQVLPLRARGLLQGAVARGAGSCQLHERNDGLLEGRDDSLPCHLEQCRLRPARTG